MTNAQKWVAGFVVLFVLLFIVSKVTEDNGAGIKESQESYESSEGGELSQTQKGGFELIRDNGCTSCHGAQLEGTNMAPALKNLAQYWKRDNLINYLRNPNDYSGGERLSKIKQQYENVVMPAYDEVQIKDLGRIADYLLKN